MDKTLSDALAVAAQYGLTDREVAAVVEAATAARREVVARPGLVAMTHPDLPDRTQIVDPDAVEVYTRSGWRLAPDDAPDDDEAEAVTVKATKTKTPAKKETP
jgi:hypothetical protein